jgi:hypothetical protein
LFKGASPGELLIEAARRNNTDLLQEIIDGCGSAEKAAVLLNETKTVLGNYIYHEAALRGNCAYISPFTIFPSPSHPKGFFRYCEKLAGTGTSPANFT